MAKGASVAFLLLICCTSQVIGAHELENSLEENFKDSSVKGLGNEAADSFVPWNDKQLGDTNTDQLQRAPEETGNFPDKTKLTNEDTDSGQTRNAGLESFKDDKNTDGTAAQHQQMSTENDDSTKGNDDSNDDSTKGNDDSNDDSTKGNDDSTKGNDDSTKGNKAADRSIAPSLSNEYDETEQAIADNVQLTDDEVDSQSVCYIRNCSWVQRRIHQNYPYTVRYHYHFRYPVKVRRPYRTIYACGKYLFRHYRVRVCKRVPYRRRVCRPNSISVNRQCRFQTTFRRICGYRWRSIYKKRYCTRTVYIYRTIYRYRWIWRYRTTYRYRFVTVRRYICTYTQD